MSLTDLGNIWSQAFHVLSVHCFGVPLYAWLACSLIFTVIGMFVRGKK